MNVIESWALSLIIDSSARMGVLEISFRLMLKFLPPRTIDQLF
jgi:hypothetical protein